MEEMQLLDKVAVVTGGARGIGRSIVLVHVRADAGPGAIRPGDLLTTSSLPGHAMKATDPVRSQGAILGKAMTGLAEGRGLVLVLVSLQ